MPSAHPPELRERVVEAYRNGEGTYDEIAARFCVGRASVSRWLALDRNTGSLATRPWGGARHPLKVDPDGMLFIRDLLLLMPDSTLGELTHEYEEAFGVTMHERTMGRTLRRMGITRKRGR